MASLIAAIFFSLIDCRLSDGWPGMGASVDCLLLFGIANTEKNPLLLCLLGDSIELLKGVASAAVVTPGVRGLSYCGEADFF